MSPETSVCEGCHALHHQPEASCVACHAEGAMAIHPRAAHDGCEACHGERVAGITQWTRQVCTVCHVDRVEHNAPMDCVTCHRIPALGEPDPDQAEERR
jgi:hypothetical protein